MVEFGSECEFFFRDWIWWDLGADDLWVAVGQQDVFVFNRSSAIDR